MGSANEGRHYTVTSSLIGWAHTQNDPCIMEENYKIVMFYRWCSSELGVGMGGVV